MKQRQLSRPGSLLRCSGQPEPGAGSATASPRGPQGPRDLITRTSRVHISRKWERGGEQGPGRPLHLERTRNGICSEGCLPSFWGQVGARSPQAWNGPRSRHAVPCSGGRLLPWCHSSFPGVRGSRLPFKSWQLHQSCSHPRQDKADAASAPQLPPAVYRQPGAGALLSADTVFRGCCGVAAAPAATTLPCSEPRCPERASLLVGQRPCLSFLGP